MAGAKGRSGGHNRKATRELKADGGFRSHRHGDRADVKIPVAKLSPPEILTDAQRELWLRVVSTLPVGLVTKLDQELLLAYCDQWEAYLMLRRSYLADPIDKDIRISYKSCVDTLDKLGRQLGWSTQSRPALQMPSDKDDNDDPFSTFLDRMGSKPN